MTDYIRSEGQIDSDAVLAVLSDIGKALSYAEHQQLIHRDVKPANILVNAEGIYKLADLGIAIKTSQSGVVDQQRQAFGSAHYVAPEQARGGTIDPRADIYGLGATCYHLLAGRTMFEGNARELIRQHIRIYPTPIGEICPECPPVLADLIMQMVAKSPDERPDNASLVVEKADEVLRGDSENTTVSSNPRRRRRRRRRR